MAARRPGFVYFDVETAGLDPRIHPVIAAAYQHMDARGPTDTKPKLLTAWRLGGEASLLAALTELGLFIAEGPHAHDFIPVGSSLDFTLAFAANRMRLHRLKRWDDADTARFLASKPRVDLKGALVLMNRGALVGADVRRFTRRKVGSGLEVVRMYEEKNFAGIERYIREEAAAFFDVFPTLSGDLRRLGDSLR